MIAQLLLISAMLMPANGTAVEKVTLEQLEKRFEQGADTVYVVNFWATWCKPCIEELPAFDRYNRSVTKEPIKVILVSVDDVQDLATKVIPFVKKKGITPEVVLLNEKKPNEWIDKVDESWSGAIPATLFVDVKNGRRLFLEQDFTFEELVEKVAVFTKARK